MEYQRPTGFRFQNGGFNVRYKPDALTPNKYVVLRNVRETSDLDLQTRPGTTVLFSGSLTQGITDIKSYATAAGDFSPRFLARDASNLIWLDNSVNVGSLAAGGNGVTMMPFRPNASMQSWMYIAGLNDYQKFSVPSPTNVVTAAKVGIAEPQLPVDFASGSPPLFVDITSLSSGWTAGGTAAAPTFNATLLADNTAGGAGGPDGTNYGVIVDPFFAGRYSVGVATNYYLPGMLITIGTARAIVENVLQPIATTTISAIRYLSGSTGTCDIVLPNDLTGILDKGALLVLDNGVSKEAVLVQSIVGGGGIVPNCQIRTSTVATYAAGNSVFGELTVVVFQIGGGTPTGAISIRDVTSSLTVGVGTLTQNFSIGTIGAFSPSDYVHLALFSQNGWSQASVTVTFNVGVSGNFTANILTVAIPVATLAAGNNQSVLINVPISALLPSAGTLSNLASSVGVQLSINNTGPTTVFGIIGFWLGGGGGPDVGYVNQGFKNSGAPYKYVVVPRASATGVIGNPSPIPFYGVNPHRENILVKTSLLSAAYDPQIDTWDIYRTGGSITSYQYVGSALVGADFIDSATDAAAAVGQPLQLDNFEPWPTLDVPFMGSTAGEVALGTVVRLNISTPPATILKWLPGNIMILAGIGSFTLRSRPTLVSGTTYQFEFTVCAGVVNATSAVVSEPIVANQHLPFIAGPDSNGFFYAVGDPLRPGTVYQSKAFNPDSAPEVNTYELCPPSEPLIGVEVLRGVVYVCSTKRWWAGYPVAQFQTPVAPFTNFVEQAIGPTFAAAWGHTTNNQLMAYWSKRGIHITDGGPAKSITDADLLTLFPHDGIQGAAAGPLFPPDYNNSSKFRLNFLGDYLYADYPDTQGTRITLVYNIKTNAWISNDTYTASNGLPGSALTHYAHEQPEGALATSASHASYAQLGLYGGNDGNVYVFTPNHNDASTPISCRVQTFEWDGGDARANFKFGDGWLDCVPRSTITTQPTLFGVVGGAISTISASSNRTLTPFSIGGQIEQKFMGVNFTWTDDFTIVNSPTTLVTWQLSAAPQAELIVDRATDFYDLGQASYVQGVMIDLDTFGQTITIQFVDELGNSHPLTFNHNGRKKTAYSFPSPFVAHLIKLVPPAVTTFPTTSQWRLFDVKFISQPTPESALQWGPTQFTAHGLIGYHFLYRLEASYSSTTPITLTVTSFDGQSPQAVTLPSTGGVTQKIIISFTFNKGTLFKYLASSTSPFQLFLNDWRLVLGQWGKDLQTISNLGGMFGDQANI